MQQKLCFVTCKNFEPEISQIIREDRSDNIEVLSLPINCSGSLINDEASAKMISLCENKYQKIVFLGSTCLAGINKPKNTNQNVSFIKFNQCFNLLLNPEIAKELIRNGNYLVSNGWFHNYEKHIKDWGFDRSTAKQFFRESLKKIIFLDTGLPGDYQKMLSELSEYMGLPYETMPVGLDYCRLILSSEIFKWKEEINKLETNEKLAKSLKQTTDYALAFNQINALVGLTDEQAIIHKLKELNSLLFAPKNVIYTQIQNNIPISDKVSDVRIDSTLNQQVILNENSFQIKLVHQDEIFGIITIEDVLFPQYLSHYKDLSIIISKVCGLAISNARKFQRIKESESALSEINKTKDKLFSIIGHDLRNPIANILGFSDLLLKNIHKYDVAKSVDFLQNINTSATNTFDLIENLLNWAKSQSGEIKFKPEKLNLKSTINKVLDNVSSSAKIKNITLNYIQTDEIDVFADPDMLMTILRNLITNAIKFTNENGAVDIYSILRKNQVEISISDSGVGMSEEVLEKLFKLDTNESTYGTANEQGSGLGLVLCQEFVEKLGGKIWVTSKLGKGSEFTFSIPNN